MNTVRTGSGSAWNWLKKGASGWGRARGRVSAIEVARTVGLAAASLVLFGLARYAETAG
jgi:hypothetical protein